MHSKTQAAPLPPAGSNPPTSASNIAAAAPPSTLRKASTFAPGQQPSNISFSFAQSGVSSTGVATTSELNSSNTFRTYQASQRPRPDAGPQKRSFSLSRMTSLLHHHNKNPIDERHATGKTATTSHGFLSRHKYSSSSTNIYAQDSAAAVARGQAAHKQTPPQSPSVAAQGSPAAAPRPVGSSHRPSSSSASSTASRGNEKESPADYLPKSLHVSNWSLSSHYNTRPSISGKKTLGDGATAVVILVSSKEKSKEKKMYACKIFKKCPGDERVTDWYNRIANEYEILSRLSHRNMTHAYSLLVDSQGAWSLVIDYCELGDLFSLATQFKAAGRKMSKDVRSCILKQMLRGVHYIHAMGIAHRDIKVENILINAQGELKLGDFGESFVMFDPKTDSFSSETGDYPIKMATDKVGSTPYMAPELFILEKAKKQGRPQSEYEYDPRLVDVWACAITYINILFGGGFFDRASLIEDNRYDFFIRELHRYWVHELDLIYLSLTERGTQLLRTRGDELTSISQSKSATGGLVANVVGVGQYAQSNCSDHQLLDLDRAANTALESGEFDLGQVLSLEEHVDSLDILVQRINEKLTAEESKQEKEREKKKEEQKQAQEAINEMRRTETFGNHGGNSTANSRAPSPTPTPTTTDSSSTPTSSGTDTAENILDSPPAEARTTAAIQSTVPSSHKMIGKRTVTDDGSTSRRIRVPQFSQSFYHNLGSQDQPFFFFNDQSEGVKRLMAMMLHPDPNLRPHMRDILCLNVVKRINTCVEPDPFDLKIADQYKEYCKHHHNHRSSNASKEAPYEPPIDRVATGASYNSTDSTNFTAAAKVVLPATTKDSLPTPIERRESSSSNNQTATAALRRTQTADDLVKLQRSESSAGLVKAKHSHAPPSKPQKTYGLGEFKNAPHEFY